ncbi:soluble NSF attachment family protein [Chryseobacterium sp. JUb7]|uniref:soluble NSF attachment family protein n=1 Tax=Chryseobacterium sp. JUb7 TaxID=2940599 RepID=UPI00216857FE|nr:soluble NSF attachment family protein [Chryseobacterium sp. JUb7]MCS3529991.1 tetratricopeptide (TPR) repeat protein [Chryseobacterium sp. JUb7]
MNKQKFLDKFLTVFFILAALKFVGILVQLSRTDLVSVLGNLVLFLIIGAIVFFIIVVLQDKQKDTVPPPSGRSSGGMGNGIYLDTTLFDKLRSIYEEIAQKHIAEKEYKKAAIVYMNLLKNDYRAAQTLKEGGLYNEAAAVFLKRLNSKVEAADCYVHAKQYRKAIDLYKELQHKEKVGDLYKEMNDVESANTYYQMVIDDYVNNYQMVKGSLIYRQKMEMPDEAQKILLKGWEENADPLNCLNNYFANIFDLKKLSQQIQELYEKTPSDKKIIYLEAMKYEFKKDPKLQEASRNVAYDIIAEKVSTRSEIVNELKHFNPDDQVILKDISRYKTGRNRMFRN